MRKLLCWPIKAIAGVLVNSGSFIYIVYLGLVGRDMGEVKSDIERIINALDGLK